MTPPGNDRRNQPEELPEDRILQCLNKGRFHDYYLVKYAPELSKGITSVVYDAKSRYDERRVIVKIVDKSKDPRLEMVSYTTLLVLVVSKFNSRKSEPLNLQL